MEKIASDLKESELKQRSLGKAYESLHAQASSILLLTLQWKDLEDHFDSLRNSLRTRVRELEDREKEVGSKEKEVAAKVFNLNSEVESKTNELIGIHRLIDEKIQEVVDTKNHLNSLKLSVQEHSEEVKAKENRVLEVEKLVREKEREYESVDKRIKERRLKLNWVQKSLEEKLKLVEDKENEVKRVQIVLNEYCEDIRLKDGQLNEIIGLFQERKKEFELQEEQINAAQRKIEEFERDMKSKEEKLSSIQGLIVECEKEMESKEEKLSSIRKSIVEGEEEMKSQGEKLSLIQTSLVECSKTLESREEAIREMELKERDSDLRNKLMEEWSCKLEFKEREIEVKEKRVESKIVELTSINQRVNECLNEVQFKEKHLYSLKKSLQEGEKHLDSLSQKLQLRESQLEQQSKELELKQNQFDSFRKSTEEDTQNSKSNEKTNILHSQGKTEPLVHTPANNASVPLSTSNQSSINRDGRGLQLLINEHLKRNDLVFIEISSFLQNSSDPAKLVLDAMKGFYPSNSTVDNREFELGVIRRSCILLLEELKRLSPQINPQVREEAMQLAGDWKIKMTVAAENWLEVLGFLRLLTTYELTSNYDAKDLQNLLAVVAQHEQATELSRALGNKDEQPASTICSPLQIEKSEPSLGENAANASPNLQETATEDSRCLQGFLNENLSDVIRNLIKRKHLIEAVRLICTFKLIDKFPPKPLLEEYVENAKMRSRKNIRRKKSLDAKDKVSDDQIADLRAVIQCIKDYNLESEYPSRDVEMQIVLLEKVKEVRRRSAESAPSRASKVDQQEQSTSLASNVEQEEQSTCLASNGEQEELNTSLASIVEQEEQSTSLASNVEQDEQKKSLASMVEQQEEKKSLASKVEKQEQKNPLASKFVQQEQRKSLASKVEQEQRKPLASKGEQQEQRKPPASKVEPQGQQRGKKRGSRFQAQKRDNKCHRMSESAGIPPYKLPAFTPGYKPPSSLSCPNENYGYHGKFGMAAKNHGNGSNFGALHSAGIHHPYQFHSSLRRYCNPENPVPMHSADYGGQSSYHYP